MIWHDADKSRNKSRCCILSHGSDKTRYLLATDPIYPCLAELPTEFKLANLILKMALHEKISNFILTLPTSFALFPFHMATSLSLNLVIRLGFSHSTKTR